MPKNPPKQEGNEWSGKQTIPVHLTNHGIPWTVNALSVHNLLLTFSPSQKYKTKKNNKTKKYKNRDFIRMGLNGHNVWIL